MFAQDSSAGVDDASMTLRWTPFDQKSAPPSSAITRVGRDFAKRIASVRRSHCRVLIAPL